MWWVPDLLANGVSRARVKIHRELGRRPRQPANSGKVERASGCGPLEGATKRVQRRPSHHTEGFLLLNSESSLDFALVQAYRETEYQVFATGKQAGLTLRVGQESRELLAAHKRKNADCSAFLTACNPFSEPFDAAANAARQVALAKELTSRSLAFLPGIGQHPSNEWPGEESFLVFGLTLEAAKVLGAKFEQNGLVWSGADAVAQLILLR